MNPASDVTGLLRRWSEGDASALAQLLPVVYQELRRIAGAQLRGAPRDQTLPPTALVHELFLRLVDQRRATWIDRTHFFSVASSLMRRVIIDHARAAHAAKRGGTSVLVPLDTAEGGPSNAAAADEQPGVVDILAIDAALRRLAAFDADQARIVELRFFAGLTVEETAQVMKRSARTIKREWRLARAWLHRELRTDGDDLTRPGHGDL